MGVVVLTPTMTLPRLMISSIVCAVARDGVDSASRSERDQPWRPLACTHLIPPWEDMVSARSRL